MLVEFPSDPPLFNPMFQKQSTHLNQLNSPEWLGGNWQKWNYCRYCLKDDKDDLTQLANKRYFNRSLHNEWSRLAEQNVPLSVIFLEIDYLKIYRKTKGEVAGENCIEQIARLLERYAQHPDELAARYAEEKFVIMLPKIPGIKALKTAEKIRKNVKKLAFCHDPEIDGLPDRMVTVSLGVATTVPTVENSALTLLQGAEEMLYQAKRKGRDRAQLKEWGN
jgi:diguanylate cyclase (GGDEF)-like protein